MSNRVPRCRLGSGLSTGDVPFIKIERVSSVKTLPPNADELLLKSIEAIHAGHAALVAEAMDCHWHGEPDSNLLAALNKANDTRTKALDALFTPPVPPLG